MSWIGRKIYEYLKECEEYKQTWSPKSDNLSEPPRSEEFNKDMNAGYQPKDKLDTSNPPIDENSLDEYGVLIRHHKIIKDLDKAQKERDKYKSELIKAEINLVEAIKRFDVMIRECNEQKKGCVPKTDNIPPAPEKVYIQKPVDLFNLQASIITPPAPERVPFENFKNNKKSMRKTIEHNERYTLTSIKEDGKVSITIEPKKGFAVCNVRLSVGSVETPKEPVLPKELLNPKPELQAQYDTLAKLITTRDYYNAGHVFNHRDTVYCICSGDVISVNRYECEITPLFFKDGETAQLFQKNFRNQIEQVKHLI